MAIAAGDIVVPRAAVPTTQDFAERRRPILGRVRFADGATTIVVFENGRQLAFSAAFFDSGFYKAVAPAASTQALFSQVVQLAENNSGSRARGPVSLMMQLEDAAGVTVGDFVGFDSVDGYFVVPVGEVVAVPGA